MIRVVVSSAVTSITVPSASVTFGTVVCTSAQTSTGSPNIAQTQSMSCDSMPAR